MFAARQTSSPATPGVLAASITFEPTSGELVRTCEQLVACSGLRAVYDNSVSAEARRRVRSRCESSGMTYFGTGDNVGTGTALNRLVEHALSAGAQWTLYVDQDSVMADGFPGALEAALAFGAQNLEVSIIGSRIARRSGADLGCPSLRRFETLPFVIASGMMVRNSGVVSLGGFDDDMFLDVVDHELCLRSRAAGERVIRDNGRILYHEVGRDARCILPRYGMVVAVHPPWRRELMWRNSTILVRRYGARFPTDCLRHVGVRVVDTIVGAVVHRRASYLTAAGRGLLSGLRGRPVGELVGRRAVPAGNGGSGK